MLNNRRAAEKRRGGREGHEGGFQLAGGDAQELVGSMISDYNLMAKNVEDKLSATRGTRKQFLTSRLRERSININNRNGAGQKGNRVAPVPEDGDSGGGGGGGGGGSGRSSPSSPRGGGGGGWFGVMSGSPTGGGAAVSPSGGGAAGPDANGGDHVVDIQR